MNIPYKNLLKNEMYQKIEKAASNLTRKLGREEKLPKPEMALVMEEILSEILQIIEIYKFI